MKHTFNNEYIPEKALENLPDGYTILGWGTENNWNFPKLEMIGYNFNYGWDKKASLYSGNCDSIVYAMNTQGYNNMRELEKEKHSMKITMQQKEVPVEIGQLYLHTCGNVYVVVRVMDVDSNVMYSLNNISTGECYGRMVFNIEEVFSNNKNLFKKVVASEVVIKL